MPVDRTKEFSSTLQSVRSRFPTASFAEDHQERSAQMAAQSELSSRISHLTADIVKMGEALEKLAQRKSR